MNQLVTSFHLRALALCALCTFLVTSCNDDDDGTPLNPIVAENVSSFKEIAQITIGGGQAGAAEITAYDAKSQKLFVVNNAGASTIEVVDFANPASLKLLQNIVLTNGAVNSVAAYNGILAAAVENANKQANGTVEIYDTETLNLIESVTVGALPDMVTFSPDGNYIVTANEGEPSDDYSNDPEGSVSIISVNNNYSVITAGFGGFAAQQASLQNNGLRVFGPNSSLTQDLEPEYVTISSDSKTAWVSIQENNAIAKVDLVSGQITNLHLLGFKDYGLAENAIDVSDRDNVVQFKSWQNVLHVPTRCHRLF